MNTKYSFEEYICDHGGNICSYNVKCLPDGAGNRFALFVHDDDDNLVAILAQNLPVQFAKRMWSDWCGQHWSGFAARLKQTYDAGDISPAGIMFFNELYKRNLHPRGYRPLDPSHLTCSAAVQNHYQSLIGGGVIVGAKASTIIVDEASDPDYTMLDNLPDYLQVFIGCIRDTENLYKCVDGSDVDVRAQKDDGSYQLIIYFGEDFIHHHNLDQHVAAQQFIDDCTAGNWHGVVAAIEMMWQSTGSIGGVGEGVTCQDDFEMFETYMLQEGAGAPKPSYGEAQMFGNRIIKDRGFKPDEAKPDAMDITRDMIRGK